MFKNKYHLRFLNNKSAENVDATQTEQTEQNTGDTSTVANGVNEGSSDKLFTQDEVNKVVVKRLKEVKKQYADYDDLKTKVEEFQSKLEQLSKAKKEVEEKYKNTTFNQALSSAATELNLDVELATKLLDNDKVLFTDDQPTNLKELLQVVIEKHPNLVKKNVVTPVIPQTDQQQKKFTLHKQQSSTFFNGGGLRLNMKDNN